MEATAAKKKISMIPAKPQYDRSVKLMEKRFRVTAYCRVSTELEEQESSYEAQVEYYTKNRGECHLEECGHLCRRQQECDEHQKEG